jgi:CubicO group peptidase (beta-lactamase class C family)
MDTFPLTAGDPAAAGLRPDRIERLVALVERHVAEGRHPGAQLAIARHGRLLLDLTVGAARLGPPPVPAGPDTLWLLYSNTKVVVAVALWKLVEDGELGWDDRVSDHVPEFARHGKRDVTIRQVITHQGGFPNAVMPREGWLDPVAMRRAACEFTLEWTPGSRVHYHPLAAHWVLAVLIEAITGRGFREHLREAVIVPLGLGRELHVGLPETEDARAADMHEPAAGGGLQVVKDTAGATWRRGGAPGGGAYGTARAMAALYQMLLAGGELAGRRILSPRAIAHGLVDQTGERVDEAMGLPLHRALGPHLRGRGPVTRGLGTLAAPDVFGHGGVGSSYCWADPGSGVSFAYVTNGRAPEPWHSLRLDRISNLVHSALP